MANVILEKFEVRIRNYWTAGEDEAAKKAQEDLVADLLAFANQDPEKFKKELSAIQYDPELSILFIVFEALSRDTDQWGPFFVELMDDIFRKAKTAEKPYYYLNCLLDFDFIYEDHRPYVLQLVQRLEREISSSHIPSQLMAIDTLCPFLDNPQVKNKMKLVQKMQSYLSDPDFNIRYPVYQTLKFNNLLPEGFKLALADRIRGFFKMA